MSADTQAPPLTPAEVGRLRRHLTCLERAAADPTASQEVRDRVRERIAAARVVLALYGADQQEVSRG